MLQQGLNELDIEYSVETYQRLEQYADLILKWNKVYNLTAIRNRDELLVRHFLDSLAVLPCLDVLQLQENESALRVLDVGAGAGLPGLVWAIVRPNWQIHLVDTVQKKAAFMLQAAANLGLKNVQVHHARVENLNLPPFDIITSRAFSSIPLFISLSHHLLKPAGIFAALKGRQEVDHEIPVHWSLQDLKEIKVPFLDEQRHLFVIKR